MAHRETEIILGFSAAIRIAAERATDEFPLRIIDADNQHRFVMLPEAEYDKVLLRVVQLRVALEHTIRQRDQLQFRLDGLDK